MKGYNYTIVQNYKAKYYIPYIDITFEGKGEFYLILLFFICSSASLFMITLFLKLELFFHILAFVVSGLSTLGLFYALKLKNGETGLNEFMTFYYRRIKNYRLVIDHKGNQHYITKPYKERRIYANIHPSSKRRFQ